MLLNPSIADDGSDDPTTRKLHHLSAANGAGSYVLVNLFAAVDTHQGGLHRDEAVGDPAERNDRSVSAALRHSDRVVIGWGAGSGRPPWSAQRAQALRRRVQAIWPMLAEHELWCVGQTRTGSPRHPGRGIRNDTRLVRFVPPPGYPHPA